MNPDCKPIMHAWLNWRMIEDCTIKTFVFINPYYRRFCRFIVRTNGNPLMLHATVVSAVKI